MSNSTAARTEPAGVQTQARHAYRQSVAEGQPLTGAELGEMFGRSDRWGRKVIANLTGTQLDRADLRRAYREGVTLSDAQSGEAILSSRRHTPSTDSETAGSTVSGDGELMWSHDHRNS